MELRIDLVKGRFRGLSEFSSKKVFGSNDIVSNDIIIDTGCVLTSIALKGAYFTERELYKFKKRDAESYKETGYPEATFSVGVNDREKSKVSIDTLPLNELVFRKDVGFIHKLSNFTIDGFNFGTIKAKLMYDRPGHSLLGINVLKDYHCEINKDVDGYTYFTLEKIKRSNKDRCKYILRGLLFDKRITLSEAYTCLAEEYSDDCLYESMYELLQEHNVVK